MTITRYFNRVRRVATLDELTKSLGVSGRSVLRRLESEGYYSSYTHNSRYYTLKSIAKFDRNLIWIHKKIGFTKLNNLMDLIVHCIDRCTKGFSVKEASEVVHTQVANQLGILARGGRIKRIRFTEGYVYFSLQPTVFRQQLSRRKKGGQEPLTNQPDSTALSEFDGEFSHGEIVCILTIMVNHPQYSLNKIREAAAEQGLEIDASSFEKFVTTHGLIRYKKKEHRLLSLLLEHASAGMGGDRWADPSKNVTFLSERDSCPECLEPLQSYKTQSQIVYSVLYGNFTAKVHYRYCPHHAYDPEDTEHIVSYRSKALAQVVGPSKQYAYDVMTYIGISRFLQARQIQEICIELNQQYKISISPSQVSKLSEEFLIRLSCLHASYQLQLKRLIDQQGGYFLQLDSSCENKSTAVLVGLDAITGWALISKQISSEREEFIVPALEELRDSFGVPQGVMRDMSRAFKNSVNRVFPNVPQRICHFHFLKDVGRDILEPDYLQLRSLMIQEKVASQLNCLRRDLLEPLKSQAPITSILDDLAAGRIQLNRKTFTQIDLVLLVSIIDWIMNYAQDGNGLGFPFDHSYVYFYKRCQLAYHLLLQLQQKISSAQFKDARLDTLVLALARVSDLAYESATSLNQINASHSAKLSEFNKLRRVLRFFSNPDDHTAPLSQNMGYSSIAELKAANQELRQFLSDIKSRINKVRQTAKLYALQIIIDHLERHWQYLFLDLKTNTCSGPRTNNNEEGLYRDTKRKLRRLSGKKNVCQEFNRLGAYIPLVHNLENSSYLQTVVGSIENLPEAFASLNQNLVDKHTQDFLQEKYGPAYLLRKSINPIQLLKTALH